MSKLRHNADEALKWLRHAADHGFYDPKTNRESERILRKFMAEAKLPGEA